jgi:aerobic carbon-monoxide dehydrogenase large subunit
MEDSATSREPLVGRPIRRVEDARFLTGAACYVGDFTRERMCHAVVVRSRLAHARLGDVRRSAALALPGVVAVLTASDLDDPDVRIPIRLAPLPGFDRYLQGVLARDRVRYVGEPVAVVIAEDRHVAEDAAALVTADYEPLEPVVDVHQAMSDRTVLHAGAGTNVASRYTVSRGDAAAAFAGAEYTRQETFRCHRHSAMPIETRGLVAEWDAVARTLTVWGATKVTFFNRAALARMLGLPEASVELVELDVGGSFGVRGEFYPEDFLIPLAAMRVGRPVKWIEGRHEHLLTANHSREMACELEIAARRDGTILGLRGRLHVDMGAYVRTNGGVVPAKAAQFLPGPYRVPDVECEVTALVTSKTPVGTYRAPGRFEANFFRERLVDLMAADLGLDPVDVRMRNLLTPAEMPYEIGKLVPYEAPGEYDTGDYRAALRRALTAIDYDRIATLNGRLVDGRLHGVGIGCFVESSGAGPSETARIVVTHRCRRDDRPGQGQSPHELSVRRADRPAADRSLDELSVELYTGCASSGQGHETVMAQILADELEIPIDAVRVFHGSTSFVDQGYGTYHSRAVVVGGSAITVAADQLKRQLRTLAARRTGLDEADLESRGADVYRRGRAGEAPVLALATLATEGSAEAAAALEAVGRFRPDKLTYTYGAHVAHVAVDPETGHVAVIRYVAVEDVGRAINPLLVHGQAIGAAVQGLGGAFLEELVYDEAGQLVTGTFADYAMPTSAAFPVIEAITLEDSPSTLNPLGAKGAGEGGIVATGAAAANAVAAALAPRGVTVRALPLSSAAISALLRAAGGDASRHGGRQPVNRFSGVAASANPEAPIKGG